MHTNRLMLFRGHGPVEAAASRYTAFIRNATGLGAKQISIYQAITDGVKGLEDYLVLSCVTTPEVICTNPLSASGQSIDVKAPLTDTPSPSSTTSEPSDHTQVEDTGMPAWVWGTNDVDGTDYKNMPDYDPNQEESVYESTPEPETEGLYVAREDGSMNAPSYIENYIKLWTVDSNRTDDDPGNIIPFHSNQSRTPFDDLTTACTVVLAPCLKNKATRYWYVHANMFCCWLGSSSQLSSCAFHPSTSRNHRPFRCTLSTTHYTESTRQLSCPSRTLPVYDLA